MSAVTGVMEAVEDAVVGQGEELVSASTATVAAAATEATTEQAATRGFSDAAAIFERDAANTAAPTTAAKAATTEAVSIVTNTGRLSGAHPVMAIPLTAGVLVAGYTVYNVNEAANRVGDGLDRGARAVAKAASAAVASVHPPDLSNLSKEAQEELKHLKAAASKAAAPLVTNLKWVVPVTVGVVIIGIAVVSYRYISVDV